jgi:hypothetical protein
VTVHEFGNGRRTCLPLWHASQEEGAELLLVQDKLNFENKCKRDVELGCPRQRCQRSTDDTVVESVMLFVVLVNPSKGHPSY